MKTPSNKTLKSWFNMTDCNEHGKVREEIAKWWMRQPEYVENDRKDYLGMFQYINLEHEKMGSLSSVLCEMRNLITNTMLDSIEKHDKEICDKICKCL